MFFDTRSIS